MFRDWLAQAAGAGALAQLGEHLLCKQGVSGSIPLGSTSPARSGVPRRATKISPEMKTRNPARAGACGFARIFDIVNGFLIDAVAHAPDLSRGRAVNMRHKSG